MKCLKLNQLSIFLIGSRPKPVFFDNIYQQLSAALKKCVDIARERGASSWLSAMPIQKHGFALHKRAFFDAIAFRYGWRPSNLPTTCACGKPFSIDHSLNCSFGGFPTIRHNELRDVTANLLSQVCSNVQIEPHFQAKLWLTAHQM